MMKTKSPARLALCMLIALSGSVPAMAAPAKPPAPAASGPAPAVPLRQQAIHIAYNEGDFDKVVAEIDAFTKANKTYSRNDSIFIAKHLAVVHTANPNTREKGKYYMYRLLEMVPSAELVDMFVSDEIDRIFDKVRKEFLERQQSFGVDSSQVSIPEQAPATTQAVAAGPAPAATEAGARPFYKRRGFWMMTGAGIAAVGAVVTYVHAQEEVEGRSIRIGNQTTP